ncbi:hypothetical protein VTL71DRAFT_8156 [Oculimacula yallundae]|uniref:Uncharacterized protein n=1 Tax=Oculimacula yallundae TaxID=86028 RepID=A0ABR4CYB1_9HELO
MFSFPFTTRTLRIYGHQRHLIVCTSGSTSFNCHSPRYSIQMIRLDTQRLETPTYCPGFSVIPTSSLERTRISRTHCPIPSQPMWTLDSRARSLTTQQTHMVSSDYRLPGLFAIISTSWSLNETNGARRSAHRLGNMSNE